jgi:hypothetical protein
VEHRDATKCLMQSRPDKTLALASRELFHGLWDARLLPLPTPLLSLLSDDFLTWALLI